MFILIFKWLIGGNIIVGKGPIKLRLHKKHWGPYSVEFRMTLEEAEKMSKRLRNIIEE